MHKGLSTCLMANKANTMTKHFFGIPAILIFIVFLMSCASVPLERTKELRPGMTVEQVKNILGEPYSAGLENGIYILNYHLQYYMNGSYPYVVAFDSNEKLIFFGFNDAEAQRTLQAIQTLKGTPALPTKIQIENK